MNFILPFSQFTKMMFQNEIVLLFVQNYLHEKDQPLHSLFVIICKSRISQCTVCSKLFALAGLANAQFVQNYLHEQD